MKFTIGTLVGLGAITYSRWLEGQISAKVSLHAGMYIFAVVVFLLWFGTLAKFGVRGTSASERLLSRTIALTAVLYLLYDHLAWLDPDAPPTRPGKFTLFLTGFFHLLYLSVFGLVFAISCVPRLGSKTRRIGREKRQNVEDTILMSTLFIGVVGTFVVSLFCTWLVVGGVEKNSILLWFAFLVVLPLFFFFFVPELRECQRIIRSTWKEREEQNNRMKENAIETASNEEELRLSAESDRVQREEQRVRDEARQAWELTPEGQTHLAHQKLLQEELASITFEKRRLHDERVRIERGIADSKAMKDAAEGAAANLERSRKENEALLEGKTAAANESIRDNQLRA